MEVEFGGHKCWLAVVSAGRAANVKRMHDLLGRRATWYVPQAEWKDYLAAGAPAVCGDEGSLVGARNGALEHGKLHGLTSLQFSDDLKKIQVAVGGKAYDVDADAAFGSMLSRFALSDYKLAGVAPTNNAFFSKDKASSSNLFCVGDCLAVKPSSELRFDPFFKLKEDYDFTAQHIRKYGGVLRCDDLLLSFTHYTNAGGAVAVRNEELEERMIAELLRRHPDMIRRHATRDHEVSLRAPRVKKGVL